MRRIFKLLGLIILLIELMIGSPFAFVHAQASGAIDLIAIVNSLREDNFFDPYEIDEALMTSAQQHAEYMADIGQVTHNRKDGSTLSSLGFLENIAGGENLNPRVVVYTMWTDTENWNTLLGIPFGKVGAGVAEKDGVVYYVLQVQKIETGLQAQPTIDFQITPDPDKVSDVITATPQLDGSIVHQVLDGQALWSIAIAYNITIADIIQWNNLLPTPQIFVGERLVVQLAPTATLSPTITNTGIPPTRTITPSSTPVTPSPSVTITVAPTQTPKPPFSVYSMESQERKIIGWGISIICFIGLVIVVIRGFIRK
jgi:LysM repeat protein